MIGEKLNNRYKIISLLGEGGMGEVYLAADERNGQQVAVKVLARSLSMNPEALERFRREARTLWQLDHPNIVRFIDAFEHERQYVIVMEYVASGNLHKLLKAGPLPIKHARRISLELCDALIRSHHLNIIHRDLKPENVLLKPDGTAKLADFGVARLSEGTRMTKSGTQVGTPYYMSPEAWEGKRLDAQADIWSLGVMLFEMLSGQVPFDGDTPLAVLNKVSTAPLPDLKELRRDAPVGFITIINRMLARDKSERYQTMREVAVDLDRGEPTTTPKPASPTRIVSPERTFTLNRNVKIAGIAILGLSLIGFAGNYLLQNFNTTFPQSPTTNPQPTIPQSPIINPELPTFTLQPSTTTPTHTSLPPTSTQIIISTPLTPTPTSILGIGSTSVSERDGMVMVFVPAGEFIMGSNDGESDEQPVHTVYLDDYWIDQTEVTNAMYAKCVEDGGCMPPDLIRSYNRDSYFNNHEFDNYPTIYVPWSNANAYCLWAGRRLPTEAEWEKAARGTDARRYVWGNETPSSSFLNYAYIVGDTTEVGNYPNGVSPYGAYDMAGNVWEWVNDWYDINYYDTSPSQNPNGPSSGEYKVLRGGAWNIGNIVHPSSRNKTHPANLIYNIGFRCAD